MERHWRELILQRPMYLEAQFRADNKLAFDFFKALSDALVLRMPCIHCYPLHLEKVFCREDKLLLLMGRDVMRIDLNALANKDFAAEIERVLERLQEVHDELVLAQGALKL